MRKLKSPFAAGAVIIVGIGYKGAERNKIGVEDIFFKGIEKEFPVAHHFLPICSAELLLLRYNNFFIPFFALAALMSCFGSSEML